MSLRDRSCVTGIHPVEVPVQACAGRSFKGAVAVPLPGVNPAARTVRARDRLAGR